MKEELQSMLISLYNQLAGQRKDVTAGHLVIAMAIFYLAEVINDKKT